MSDFRKEPEIQYEGPDVVDVKEECYDLEQKISESSEFTRNLLPLKNKLIYDAQLAHEVSQLDTNERSLKRDRYNAMIAKGSVLFDSLFECGNLEKVFEVSPTEFNLILKDNPPPLKGSRNRKSKKKKHVQWYFFSVEKMIPNTTYRFNIINFVKNNSSYKNGLRPLCYFSERCEWRRVGKSIFYFENKNRRFPGSKKKFHTLSWSFVMPERIEEEMHNKMLKRVKSDFDKVKDQETEGKVIDRKVGEKIFFSHHYPYTYRMCLGDFSRYRKIQKKTKSIKIDIEELSKSLKNHSCKILTITSTPSTFDLLSSKIFGKKKVVLITARQHPGETPSSWVMRGVIDFLLSSNEEAKKLRSTYVFKICPMLNVDGVYYGNTRCNMAGLDLNRNWARPRNDKCPTVFAFKEYVKKMVNEQGEEVFLYLDLHGHSKRRSSFMYGNSSTCNDEKIDLRLFPKLLQNMFPSYFFFGHSSFSMKSKKKQTARVVVHKELGVKYSYTNENSFLGGFYSNSHFIVKDYIHIGVALMKALVKFSDKKSIEMKKAKEDIMKYIKPTVRIGRVEKIKEVVKKVEERPGIQIGFGTVMGTIVGLGVGWGLSKILRKK